MNLKKIIFFFILAVMLVVAICVLFTSEIGQENSTYIKGHFRSLNKSVIRSDVSYDLYLTENNSSYKISAEWSHCFLAESFMEEVHTGDAVELYQENGAVLFSIPQVAWLSAGGTNYLSMDCVNDKIRQNRYTIPPFLLGFIALAIGFFYFQEKKQRGKSWFDL